MQIVQTDESDARSGVAGAVLIKLNATADMRAEYPREAWNARSNENARGPPPPPKVILFDVLSARQATFDTVNDSLM